MAWVKARVRARLEATVMCGLIVKCALLIVMIHLFRALGQWAGPRFSGLALGLPSTTAVVLIFCGCEQGSSAATQMAESGLLGLVAAVSLPLAFIGSVRLGWPLWGAIAASVGGYLLVAARLGCLPATGALPKVISPPRPRRRGDLGGTKSEVRNVRRGGRVPLSGFRRCSCALPLRPFTSCLLAIFERLAGPSWAGLVSTFPSLSLVVLVVTYLEAGPAESSRVAQVLPIG